LISAHIALLRAELGDILRDVMGIVALGAAALVVALLVAITLYVGGFLFLGEWLFGSMGWGLAHGVFLGVAIIVILGMAILGAPAGRSVLALVLSVLVVIGLAVLMGSNATYDLSGQVAAQLAAPFDNPAIVAALTGAMLVGIVLAILPWRLAGPGAAVVGLGIGLIVGAILGLLVGGVEWAWPPAVGFAITIGLIVWPMLHVAFVWPAIDVEARFGRLQPKQSIEAFEQTREWLEERWSKR
jgi:MFS family permease